MNSIERIWTPEDVAAAAALEAWETDQWAADALFRVELFPRRILDPCCGRGVLGDAALRAGYGRQFLIETDIHDWGRGAIRDLDFLAPNAFHGSVGGLETGVAMNPPFTKAIEFVERALGLGARKVACFQRWAWWAESRTRRRWLEANPPQRIWVCGDRATCFPITMSEHDRKFTPDGKKRGDAKIAHAWMIFEPAHRGMGTQIGKIWNPAKDKRWA